MGKFTDAFYYFLYQVCMKIKLLIYFIAFGFFCVTATAQIKKAGDSIFVYPAINFLKLKAELKGDHFVVPQFSSFNNFRLNTRALLALKYEIPKGAIFCRMEDNLRDKFNIWIKIHAGNGEAYHILPAE